MSNDVVIALKTEANPLIPHDQGIKKSSREAMRESPRGKGMPIWKASGAINMTVNKTLKIVGIVIVRWRSGDSKKA